MLTTIQKRTKGQKIEPAKRDILQREAYQLNLKHFSYEAIRLVLIQKYGDDLSVKTIGALIASQRAQMRVEMNQKTRDDHLQVYLATLRMIEQDAWRRLAETEANGQNVTGLQGNILAAAKGACNCARCTDERRAGEQRCRSRDPLRHERIQH